VTPSYKLMDLWCILLMIFFVPVATHGHRMILIINNFVTHASVIFLRAGLHQVRNLVRGRASTLNVWGLNELRVLATKQTYVRMCLPAYI
jgi:hypothetical protein